jgi:hypothetical protein
MKTFRRSFISPPVQSPVVLYPKKMTLEQFTKLIETSKSYQDKFSKLYNLGVDLTHINDEYYSHVVKPLMEAQFGDKLEMVEWFLWERNETWGKKAATDREGNPICYDIPSLYEYVMEEQK